MNALAKTSAMPALGTQISAMVRYADVHNRTDASMSKAIIAWEEVHEKVWRLDCTECDFSTRRDDVERIYRSGDLEQVKDLFDKYDVVYVYVGDLERQEYGAGLEGRFAGFMDVAYDKGGVTIYRVRD